MSWVAPTFSADRPEREAPARHTSFTPSLQGDAQYARASPGTNDDEDSSRRDGNGERINASSVAHTGVYASSAAYTSTYTRAEDAGAGGLREGARSRGSGVDSGFGGVYANGGGSAGDVGIEDLPAVAEASRCMVDAAAGLVVGNLATRYAPISSTELMI